jgi:hypothetical protein
LPFLGDAFDEDFVDFRIGHYRLIGRLLSEGYGVPCQNEDGADYRSRRRPFTLHLQPS